MSKFLIILSIVFFFFSCSTSTEQNKKNTTIEINKEGLTVYAFHGTRQCETCKNMKVYTKSTLNKYFLKELKNGTVSYQIIDVDDEKNYDLSEKFEATGTALMISKVSNGKEKIEDWSDFAFEFALGEQNVFEDKLKVMIHNQLK
jgi:thioredoxin-related protein